MSCLQRQVCAMRPNGTAQDDDAEGPGDAAALDAGQDVGVAAPAAAAPSGTVPALAKEVSVAAWRAS